MIFKKTIVQMILHFQKEINVIMYIIEKKIKLNYNHLIWTKSKPKIHSKSNETQNELKCIWV